MALDQRARIRGAVHVGAQHLERDNPRPTPTPQAEEEEYTQQIIDYFNEGLVPLPEGVTLRAYLAEKLNW